MKKIFILFIFTLFSFGCGNGSKSQTKNVDPLVVISYGRFGFHEFWESVVPVFEKKYDCKVKIKTAQGDTDILEKIIDEKENPSVDVAVGVPAEVLYEIREENIFESSSPSNYDSVKPYLIFDEDMFLIPFAYAYLAFVYDSEEIKEPPRSFGEIQDGIWKDKIIIVDPRTSDLGLSMLDWTVAQFGNNGYGHFWRAVKGNILTIAKSGEEAYKMLRAGEAPIILTLDTRLSFYGKLDKSNRYKMFTVSEGSYIKTECIGKVKNCKNPELAEKFIEFMLTKDVQDKISYIRLMRPAVQNIDLPRSFAGIPEPGNNVSKKLAPEIIGEKQKKWIKKWVSIMKK
ncbi:MAG: hypothetical protein CSB55_00700 [Candidatus Cloacimonadota bacterium]|nr:MAG: hypothetical protein CSB55_00700 [Candidatus Cloacimonadota bacterium]